MSDTWLDGGGVIADQPLPQGAWIRCNLGSPASAVTVHVDGDSLRIAGQYRPLRCEQVARNELRISTLSVLAHRASYEHHIGPIPDGMDLDHLCRVRHCIAPHHLEPVSHSVNIQRGHDARLQGRCYRGHDQTLPNARWTEPTTGRSYCRQCKADREKAGRERRKAG